MESLSVLLVEDDRVVRCIIEGTLRRAGVQVLSLGSAAQAVEALGSLQFDLLITDLQLPEGHGMDVIAAARSYDSDIESIVITAAGSLDTAIAAIGHGVFEYFQKPLDMHKVMERVRSAGERRRNRQSQRLFREHVADQLYYLPHKPEITSKTMLRERNEQHLRAIGPLTVDPYRRTVDCAGQRSELSNGEMKLLLYMADHRERVIGPRQIVRDVFGYECDEIEARDLVKARVHKLRRKIEFDPQAPRLIVSIRGAGYVLTTDATTRR
ncbi:MAG: response regulator transcription factor [Oscillochloris sp.]|nr:response regulator transcription factor [Oscillochloris sp.]